MSTPTLDEARAAILRGERVHTRKILRSVLMENPRDEQAWLLMARVVDTQAQVIDCLERAAKINPQNLATRRALAALQHPHPAAPRATSETIQPLDARQAAVIETAKAPMIQMRRKARRLPEEKAKIRPPRRYVNASLWIGAALVFLVAFLSVLGPMIATGDPLKETVIIKVGGTWVKPPFSPFEVPGFPLGSDQFGRNLYSRILYAIQPTMVMVIIVALVRLFLGTVIGLGAGWSRGRTGRLLDTLISGALSVPVFMIALGAIAMLGASSGNLLLLAQALKAPESLLAVLKATSNSTIDQILPFVLGLSINGWGETARIVREQTQMVRGQLYIEAAHAMGASSGRILKQHVLRQIMSMVWMLFAFEISSTLMVTAGLGFLGYYIGGDVWIEVADFVSRRLSGTPELGQMLATSWTSLTEPWPMVLIGTVIFLAVLGFNLLGEGLRVRLNPENINRNSLFARMKRAVSSWTEEYITYPTSNWLRQHAATATLAGVLLVVLVTGGIWLKSTLFAPEDRTGQVVEVPGGQLWSGERGNPYGTRSSPEAGPQAPTVIWQFQEAGGLANGLAVSKEGTIYLGSLQKKLMALNPDGTISWEAGLDEVPMSAPAVGVDGTIYVTGNSGGLTAFNPQGEQLWRYQPDAQGQPAHGAITAEDGSIYYLLENAQRGDTLVALAADGSLRWSKATGTKAADTALRLSPDSEEIYVKNLAFSTDTGELLTRNLPTKEDPVLGGREQLFVGADQQRYMLAGHNVMRWKPQGGDFSLVQRTEWNYQSAGFNQNSSFPMDAGASSDQKIWLFYSWQYGGTMLIWLEPAGEVIGISSLPPSNNSILAGIDSQNTAYVCGRGLNTGSQKCVAYRRGSAQPEWEIAIEGSMTEVSAAALAAGRLYVVTKDGFLFVIGQGGQVAETETGTAEAVQPTEEATGQTAGAGETPAAAGELLWTYQFPEVVGGGLSEQEDGSLTGMTVDNELIKIDAQGKVVSQIMVEPGPYQHPEGRFIIEPIALSNGSYLVVSSEKSAYAMDAAGAKLWETALEADPAGMTERRGDTVYLSDLAGNLYAFGAQGLLWQFKPDGATKATNRPIAGPDGRLYYVVLIEHRAHVQAVNPDGTPSWQAPVKTGFFTYDLQINGAGTLLFLREDIYDTQAGMRLDLTPPFRVDEYIMGEDGLNYVRTGHVVSQWELTENGMEIVKTASWNYQSMGSAPFMTFVTAQKVIWLYYGNMLIWLDMDGNVLNTIPLEHRSVERWDEENTRYYSCQQPIRSDQLECMMYTVDSDGPVWEMTITGLPDTQWGWITEDGLTAITKENVVYRLKVDWPEPKD